MARLGNFKRTFSLACMERGPVSAREPSTGSCCALVSFSQRFRFRDIARVKEWEGFKGGRVDFLRDIARRKADFLTGVAIAGRDSDWWAVWERRSAVCMYVLLLRRREK